jgi:hypothetical protein
MEAVRRRRSSSKVEHTLMAIAKPMAQTHMPMAKAKTPLISSLIAQPREFQTRPAEHPSSALAATEVHPKTTHRLATRSEVNAAILSLGVPHR